MFRFSLQCYEVFSLACKIVGRTKTLRCDDKFLFKSCVKYNYAASVICACSSVRILKHTANGELFGALSLKFISNSIIDVRMSPRKRPVCSPSKETNKSKTTHKKSKHKHKKSKSKQKHKKYKSRHDDSKYMSKHGLKKHRKGERHSPITSMHVRTLGELIVANCSKIRTVNNSNILEHCDLATTNSKQTKCTVTSTNTADAVIIYDSKKNSSLLRVNRKIKSAKLGNDKETGAKDDLCMDCESLCTANSDVSSVLEPPLVDLVGYQQDTNLRTTPEKALSSLENSLKLAELSETGNVLEKAVGITTLQREDQSILTSYAKEVKTSNSGQCLEPGRYWIYSETMMEDMSKWKRFKLMSYNVLSQSLLEEHPYLYRYNDARALEWNFRSQLLFAEIQNLDADILCLQEVQHDHLHIFERQLETFGYRGLYKKRSHKRVDGVAIFYKTQTFALQEYTSVEFFQPDVPVLNRDNVALIAKLVHKDFPTQSIVVATTHLLFNMNRHDVKLAQTQLLLAEVERFAYAGIGKFGAQYHPVIITGDMNFKPFSGVYKLLTQGHLHYEGLVKKNLTERVTEYSQVLNNTLLPRRLQVTDSCQHWGILPLREHSSTPDRRQEIEQIKIHNSDFNNVKKLQSPSSQAVSVEKYTDDVKSSKLLRSLVSQPSSSQTMSPSIEIQEDVLPSDRFETGELTHPFHFQSAYADHSNEVTTYHTSWVTVDYIFFSRPKDDLESGLTLLATYKLPTFDEAVRLGRIPNFNSPSDHYPLLVIFGLDSELQKSKH